MNESDRSTPPSGYHWTKPKLMRFLQMLGRTGSVKEAAAAAGMSRQSAYRLRARLGPDFARVWDEGAAIGRLVQGDTDFSGK